MELPKPGSLVGLTERHREVLAAAVSRPIALRDFGDRYRYRAAQRVILSLAARGLLREAGAIRAPGRGRPTKVWRATDVGRLVAELLPHAAATP